MSQTANSSGGDKTVVVTGGGLRLDQFLAQQEGIKSRSAAAKLIDAGNVRVNGAKEKRSSTLMREGDKVTYDLPRGAEVPSESGKTTPLPILHEDDHCFVIRKPAGLAVQPGTGMEEGEETVISALKPLFRERNLPFSEAEVLVHRLDKDTTGCLLIAKTPEAHMKLQEQFAGRTVEKAYLALVSGQPNPASAIIDAPIGRHGNERTKMSVMQPIGARESRTTYRTIGKAQGVALVECDLHTGRTHQIRVHMQSIGHPVLGDDTYCTKASKDVSKDVGADFMCLHAWKLSFKSPSGKKVSVQCPLPKRFENLLTKLEIKIPS